MAALYAFFSFQLGERAIDLMAFEFSLWSPLDCICLGIKLILNRFDSLEVMG